VTSFLDDAAPRGPRKLATCTFAAPGSVGLLLEFVDGSDAIVVTSVAAHGPAADARVPVGARLAAINGTDVTANVDFDAALRLCAARPLTLDFLEPL
jgi:predicted metalloprotease with PDZ domain